MALPVSLGHEMRELTFQCMNAIRLSCDFHCNENSMQNCNTFCTTSVRALMSIEASLKQIHYDTRMESLITVSRHIFLQNAKLDLIELPKVCSRGTKHTQHNGQQSVPNDKIHTFDESRLSFIVNFRPNVQR